MKILKQNKAITLIALIITIIVMLILVAVTITIAVNGGLFNYAREAGTKTNEAKDAEQEYASIDSGKSVDYLIDKYTSKTYTQKELEEMCEEYWDISKTSSDNVKAYVVKNSDNTTYTLYVAGKGKMKDFDTNWDYEVTNTPWTMHYNESTAEIEGNNYKIKNIIVQKGIENIGQDFMGCRGLRLDDSLQELKISNGLTNIGYGAFWACEKLEIIDMPDSITNIEERAFNWCTSLKSVILPENVINIGDGAFAYCTKLQTITVPKNVTSVGWQAFSDVPKVIYNGPLPTDDWGALSVVSE